MDGTSWMMRMLAHPKAVREFQYALNVIKPTMIDPQVSRDEKRQVLNVMVNELSEDTFKLKPIVEQIMTIINMKKEVCEEYLDSESQTEGILGWLPRMKKFRGMLLEEVKKHRKEEGLKP